MRRMIGVVGFVALLLGPASGWAMDAETQAAKDEDLCTADANHPR